MTRLHLLVTTTLLLWSSTASAAVFTVTATTDAVDAAPGDGSCRTAAGDCTLRAAIQEANALAGADSINLPAGTYVLTIPFQFVRDDTAARDDLDITSDVTIAGASAASTAVAACAVDQRNAVCPGGQGIVDRVFHVLGGATVAFSNLTIANGRFAEGAGGIGGGILAVEANVTLTNVVVTNNFAGARGGGLFVVGTLVMQSSTVSRNFAPGSDGGGIIGAGPVTIVDSLISENFSAFGGGISQPGGSLTIDRTTVRSNVASAFNGGGVQTSALTTIRNSTISDNLAAAGMAGGINAVNGVVITNSTVSGNTALDCAAINTSPAATTLSSVTISANTATRMIGGLCGGSVFTTTIRNTILAGNHSPVTATTGADCDSLGASGGFNLIGDGTGCSGFVNRVNGDQVGTSAAPIDPRLGPLADNGGPTQTHALVNGSPALDAGNPTGCTGADNQLLAADQRGGPRAIDGNGDGTVRCDTGALESVGALTTFSIAHTRPTSGGNAGSVATLLYGAGFVSGMSVKLARAGQPDINGQSVSVNDNGLVAATTFNLVGRPSGLWDVVVTRPDGTSATAFAAFAIEDGGAPVLWADVVGRARVAARRPAKYFVIFGNRGKVDAFAVPIGISLPPGTWEPNFSVSPPPVHAGQVGTDWNRTPVLAPAGTQGELQSALLLLPVVPAGFIGVLEFTFTGDAQGPFEITFGVGTPYLQPALNPRVVAAFVAGARAYAQRELHTDISARAPAMQAYIADQLQAAVSQGSTALLTSLGSRPPIYSVPHLIIDLARFAAVQPE